MLHTLDRPRRHRLGILAVSLAFAPDGALWVERYPLPGENPAIDIFDPGGTRSSLTSTVPKGTI